MKARAKRSAVRPETAGHLRELRRQAEQKLKRKRSPRKSGRAAHAAGVARLVHELEVHQVELETQNAELQETRDRLEAMLRKYTDLYDFSPVGYFSLGADHRIRLANLSGARLLGMDRALVQGLHFERQLAPASRREFLIFLQQVFSGATRPACEVALLGPPRRTVNIEVELAADRKECRLAVVDVTARKQAEETLRGNQKLFLALIEQAPLGMFLVDDRLHMLQINPKAQVIFKNIHPLFGRDISEILRILWPPEIAAAIVSHLRATLETGEPYASTAFSERRQDTGNLEFYEWQLQRIALSGGQLCVVCFFNDVTVQRQAEAMHRRMDVLAAANESANREIVRRRMVETCLKASEQSQRELLTEARALHTQLRHLTRQIITAQEEERKKISRELHDDVMQTLIGINIELSSLARAIGQQQPALKARLAQTQSVVRDSVNAVHRFARELRPTVLDDFGLIPALQDYIKTLAHRKKIQIQLTAAAGAETLTPASQIALYRVAQEALTNVGKHAKASRVNVSVLQAPHGVTLEIADNGRAFNVGQVRKGKSRHRLGLVGMRERVEMVGGEFSIRSVRSTGTTVRAEFPFAKKNSAKKAPVISEAPGQS